MAITGLPTANPLLPTAAPVQGPAALGKPGGAQAPGTAAEFKQALEKAATDRTTAPNGTAQISGVEKLKFSSHAVDRMRSRGIVFQPEEMQKIENAVAKAAAKGSKDSLILSGDNALIVSVKNKTIVTVVDKSAMKDNVFTNIDSTVVV